MPPIRNSCLARGIVSPAGNVVVYTVPVNYVTLLKHIYVRASGGSTGLTTALLLNDTSTVGIQIASQTLTQDQMIDWNGWVAMNQNDQLMVQTTTGTAFYWLSGATLPHIAGF